MRSVKRYVQYVRRLIATMPADYLIIDIRSNPGGNLEIAECLMQLFTPHEVEPLQFQFRATREIERFISNDGGEVNDDFKDWVQGVTEAVANGQQYSTPAAMTDKARANVIGQEYYGTVALLIDGITYSSGDIFAAYQDSVFCPVLPGDSAWQRRFFDVAM